MAERYTLERLLGEGANGKTYLASDRDNNPVAIKVAEINDDSNARLEVDILRRLSILPGACAHLACVRDAFFSGAKVVQGLWGELKKVSTLNIVMDYVEPGVARSGLSPWESSKVLI
jgi:serine/threonine protein kinase